MRFNIRKSNYSRAGKAAADEVVNIHAAARRNSPDYGKMVQQAANIRSAVKRAGISAAADVSVAGINAAAKVEGNKIVGKAKRGLKKEQRKAGALGLAGKFFSNAGALAGEKRDKREVGGEDEYFKTEMARIEERNKDLQTKLEQSQSGTATSKTDTSQEGSSTSSKPGSSTSVDLNGTYSGGKISTEDATAIRATAQRLGVDPYTLGGLFEMESSHRPNVWGGAGGKYRGLIQFGPGARSEVGLPDRDMTISEQLPYVEAYFNQRGFKKGMGATELYRTVLVGNPNQSGTDSWGTNSDEAASRMLPGGDLYERAKELYGTWTPSN